MRRGIATTARSIIPAVAVTISACVAGPDGPSPTDPHGFTTTTGSPATLTLEESLAAFRVCLRDRGVNIGPIRLDAFGRPRLAEALGGLVLADRTVLDALGVCGDNLSSRTLDLASDPEMADLVQGSLRALTDCMRLWGVKDFPDPVPGFDGIGAPFPTNLIPWADPDLAVAATACRDEILGT